MKSSKWGVGLHAIDWLVARQLGKLKGGTCLKSHSQGGGSRGQVSVAEQEWQELCVRLLLVTV